MFKLSPELTQSECGRGECPLNKIDDVLMQIILHKETLF